MNTLCTYFPNFNPIKQSSQKLFNLTFSTVGLKIIKPCEEYLTVRWSGLSHIRNFNLTLAFLLVLVSLKSVKKSKQLHTYTYIHKRGGLHSAIFSFHYNSKLNNLS